MNKFTSGEWKILRTVRYGGHRLHIYIEDERYKKSERLIATIWPQFDSQLELDANARLIVASPKLYELCKALLEDETVYTHHWTRPASHVITNECNCHIGRAKAIISKIEESE